MHVDLPNHWGTGGESFWARPLGGDLYQLDNVPFYAYGLNYGDVVRATEDAPGLKPEMREVALPSGHQTDRVFFETGIAEKRMLALLATLEPLAVSFERATERFFALDLEPHADLVTIRSLCALLGALMRYSGVELWRLRERGRTLVIWIFVSFTLLRAPGALPLNAVLARHEVP